MLISSGKAVVTVSGLFEHSDKSIIVNTDSHIIRRIVAQFINKFAFVITRIEQENVRIDLT